MSDLLIVLGAAVLVILSSAWWPAIGRAWWDWRFNHMLICWACRRYIWSTWLRDMPGTPCHHRCGGPRRWAMPAWTGPDSPQAPVPADDPDRDDEPRTDDDEWADQLHRFNQLGKFGDLTRPAKDLTHYEIEAVIRDLGVPEWVPERWRQAA